MDFTDFLSGYITTALWSSYDDKGAPLDERFSPDDLAPECKHQMITDAEKFFGLHQTKFYGITAQRAGHLFWLNRNGHGSGFWDEIYLPEPYQKTLSTASKAFGEYTLYVGDDNFIHGG